MSDETKKAGNEDVITGAFKVFRADDPSLQHGGLHGYDLVQVFHEDVESFQNNYDAMTGRTSTTANVLRQGRLLMRRTTDKIYKDLDDMVHATRKELDEAKAGLRKACDTENELKRVVRNLEKSIKTFQDASEILASKLTDSETSRRKMEADLGKLREKLGTERFHALLEDKPK